MSVTITTLKKRSEFLRMRRAGKFTCPYFVLRFLKAEEAGEGARVGYTVTTKCGNAVVRNRIKRRLRALVRELFPEGARPGVDYNFIALETGKLEQVPQETLKHEMIRALAYAEKRA